MSKYGTQEIILLDGSKHKGLSSATEYLVKKNLKFYEKRLAEIEKMQRRVDVGRLNRVVVNGRNRPEISKILGELSDGYHRLSKLLG